MLKNIKIKLRQRYLTFWVSEKKCQEQISTKRGKIFHTKSRITPFSDKNRSNRQRNLRVKRVKFSAEVRHANVAVLEF